MHVRAWIWMIRQLALPRAHVDADGDDEDGEYDKEEDGVHEDGDAAGVHVAELDHPRPRRDLEQQPRRQQDEQDHRHDHRAPIRHTRS